MKKKPIIIKAFNRDDSESLAYSSGGGNGQVTFARPHNEVNCLKLPTICLFEFDFPHEHQCYIGIMKRKAAVSTLDSRLTIVQLYPINIPSLELLCNKISNKRFKNQFNEHLKEKIKIEPLTPRLSSHIIGIIAEDPQNQKILESITNNLPGIQTKSDLEINRENALKTALEIFGYNLRSVPRELFIKSNSSTALSSLNPIYIREDNVIQRDVSQIEGYLLKNMDITGKAVFLKNGERLEVYTANRNYLEEAFGVDLIYYNQTLGSIVMVQYKMLEEASDNKNWIFRLDNQTKDEISRMKIPEIKSNATDYRLNREPFYFKFVQRRCTESNIKSYIISLDHLNKILNSHKAIGPRGGIRIDYPALEGTYLRESDFISLIRSGYIGTHRVESEALITIISEISRGNKELIFALQRSEDQNKEK